VTLLCAQHGGAEARRLRRRGAGRSAAAARAQHAAGRRAPDVADAQVVALLQPDAAPLARSDPGEGQGACG
jgi:hypothetical protein